MNTYEWTPNHDSATDPLEAVYGQRAVYMTSDGDRLVGVLEANPRGGIYAIIRFADGTWGRANETIELLEDNEAIERMQRAARSPGVLLAELYDDGVEIVGSPHDHDDLVEFIDGVFEHDLLVDALAPLPVNDNRGRGDR